MKLRPLTKMTFNLKTKGNKITFLILFLGAVLASTAPFLHMIYPKTPKQLVVLEETFSKGNISEKEYKLQRENLKEEIKLFGFRSARHFWFAIGRSITIFYLGIYLMFCTPFINEPSLQKITRLISFLTTGIGLYFMIWAFWPRGDFHKNLYYISMIIVSVFGTFVAYWLTNFRLELKRKIGTLIRFIAVDAYHKYVKKEDRDEYLQDSYSVYDEITKP